MRKKKKSGQPDVEINLPITPMLDMSFQLLTFFIFTYHPSAMEGQMAMLLPQAGQNKAQSVEQSKPTESDTELPLPSDLTVFIRTAPENQSPSEYVVEG